ncbi:MAG: hypothetical protein ACLSB9_26815 [Hydrogeniiclostridium mannosilyticum]
MGNRKWLRGFFLLLVLLVVLTGCIRMEKPMEQNTDTALNAPALMRRIRKIAVTPSAEVVELENGFSVVGMTGTMDDGFISGWCILRRRLSLIWRKIFIWHDLGDIVGGIFGYNTIASENRAGREAVWAQFDWENCEI